MKPKLNPPQVCKPVRYQWSGSDGTIHRAHEKLGELVNQILPIFVVDLHGLGINLQEAA